MVEAGLAAHVRSTPVNGSLPLRVFFAGMAWAVIFSRLGSVNAPMPFLWMEARIVASRAAMTAFAAFASTPACSAR